MLNLKEHEEIFLGLEDDDRTFPTAAFELLKKLNLLTVTLPSIFGGKSYGEKKNAKLLNILKEVGKADLSVGRIYEGHINALLLIAQYGSAQQKQRYFKDAHNGKLFSVWNTQRKSDGVHLIQTDSQNKLEGAKIFCSGGLHIDRPIITAKTKKGWQMVVIETEKHKELKEDFSLWKPLGMRASVSSRIDFTDVLLEPVNLLGNIDDYSQQPSFTGGAIRFAAVQLGGAEAVAEATVAHLKKLKRTEDPYQQMRLGKIAILLEQGRLWIEKSGEIADKSGDSSGDILVNYANMMRTAILDICTEVMQLAERCVGLKGFMHDHAIEKLHRDLATYLKQPGPDLALTSVGEFVTKIECINYVR
ncbi:acyl-CoA dehydrogenase family protein [Leeuwenhoekiella sp. A16]|uniref:acyl-CoA dehydrogenase family protein n=1 Tax=unclassified Leeuwenhoekiella TaxID=2615029 RepID=UPI003A80D0B9